MMHYPKVHNPDYTIHISKFIDQTLSVIVEYSKMCELLSCHGDQFWTF